MFSVTGVSPGAMNGLLGGVYKPQAEEVTSRLISPVTMQVMGRNDGALIRAASKHYDHAPRSAPTNPLLTVDSALLWICTDCTAVVLTVIVDDL